MSGSVGSGASRRAAIAVVALAAGFALAGCSGDDAPKVRPNVLIVLWDTVRADRVSAYGYERPTTPFLEKFAAEGVLFERAVSPGMWTLPSHASLFTGLPPRTHGANASRKWLDHRFETLAEIFGRAGYGTYAFSSNPHVAEASNITQGFDTVEYSWQPPWNRWIDQYIKTKVIPEDRSTEVGLAPNAGDRMIYYKESGGVLHQALASWLDKQPEGQPFFAYLNYMEAHVPRIPSREARRRVMDKAEVQRSLEVDQQLVSLLAAMFGKRHYTAEEIEVIQRVYDAALVDLDEVTRLLIRELERRGVLDDTLVVLLSDHGENLGDHRHFGHKYSVYNTLVRVPLVIRFPGRVTPARVNDAVSVLDVFATILDLTGMPAPDASIPSRSLFQDGRSIVSDAPIVSELVKVTPKALARVEEAYGKVDWRPWMRTFRAIEEGEYKYIWGSDEANELYRITRDPGEEENLVDSDPERAAALRERLEVWVSETPVYGPALASERDRDRQLPDDILERLEALGYAQ
jgi:arylsulfatase A-like enzyme